MNFRLGILILLLISCKSEKPQLIKSFDKLYDNFLHQNFSGILDQLDQQSLKLIDRLTSPSNFNADSLAKIGAKHNIRYFCWRYHTTYGLGSYERDKSDFIRFLMTEQISIFNHDELMHLIEEKCRIGPESYAAYYYDVAGNKMLNWLRFTEDENHAYKLDLIYALQLHESSYKDIYDPSRKASGQKYDDSFMSLYQYFGQNQEDLLDDNWIWTEQLDKLRKERGRD